MHDVGPLLAVGVLLVVAGTWLGRRIGVAAPILMVLIGIGAGYLSWFPSVEIEPDWILVAVLPPILYAAAVTVPITDFRRTLGAITWLSVVLVIASTVAIGFLLMLFVPSLPPAAAFALGAVVSPPDAVAATAIGKRLGLPPRLVTILEGEGLLNDASALVLLRSAVAALAGTVGWVEITLDFAQAVAVGVGAGAVVGVVTVWVRSRVGEPTLSTAISFVVPFLAYLPAESLGGSGVLAVVTAGLVTGVKSLRHLTAQDRLTERMNWRTIQLLLENGVFLVMGYQMAAIIDEVREGDLTVGQSIGLGLVVTAALVLVRVLFVVPLIAVMRRRRENAASGLDRVDAVAEKLEDLDPALVPPARLDRARRGLQRRRADLQALTRSGLGWRGGTVLAWSGMRGVVTLAAAQSLPREVPLRAQLIVIAFTVAVVTLLGQGATLPALIRRLNVRGTDPQEQRAELGALMAEVAGSAEDKLTDPELRRPGGGKFDPQVLATMTDRFHKAANFAAGFDPDPLRSQFAELYRILLEVQQAALLDARAAGFYSTHALEAGQLALDAELTRIHLQEDSRG